MADDLERGKVPLLDDDIVLDDHGASYVFVFPRGIGVGGTVDGEEEVPNPMEECRQVFKDRRTDRVDLSDAGFPAFANGPVCMQVYQDLMRQKFLNVLQVLGLQAESFRSIDEDEVFVKISLPREGHMIGIYAEQQQYKMPLKAEVYASEKPVGAYRGHGPMHNAHGKPVTAYVEFQISLREKLEPFRQVDEIRIIERCLREWLDLDAMVRQGLLLSYFPGADHAKVMELFESWGNPKRMLCLPDHNDDDEVRDYFGEDIAFFFKWYAYYTRMLVFLAVFGLIAFCRKIPALNLSLVAQREIQVGFGFVVICWSSLFNKMYQRLNSRTQQRWGMKDFDVSAHDRSDYDPHLEGTWKLELRTIGGYAVVAVFILAFVFCEVQVSMAEAWDSRIAGLEIRRYSSYLTTAFIYAFSFTWNKVAPKLATLQNHRTQGRWEQALVFTVAPVKLFFALFPFLLIAFVKKYAGMTCANSLETAAHEVFSDAGWPHGITEPSYTQNASGAWIAAPDADLQFLDHFSYTTQAGETCIFGCYPVFCFEDDDGVHCTTSCSKQLESSLLVFFVTHSLFTLLFVSVPIILSRWEVRREQAAVREDAAARYSLLQLQAKSHPYEYQSWGGSKVDDFLELAIGFAMLSCFGSMVPIMVVPALLCNIVEYRLIAYRMTAVTRRPSPLGAEGIGSWRQIFQAITLLAVGINVGLSVVVMYPMRNWTSLWALGAFIVLEHLMLAARTAISAATEDEPPDVLRIADFNMRFLAKFKWRGAEHVPVEERPNNKTIDLGLGSATDSGKFKAQGLWTAVACNGSDDESSDGSDGTEASERLLKGQRGE